MFIKDIAVDSVHCLVCIGRAVICLVLVVALYILRRLCGDTGRKDDPYW